MLPDLAPSATGLPGVELTQLTGLALQFLFAMLRIGAFVLSAPLFAARFISLPVRIIISVCLTVPLMGQVPIPEPDALSSLSSVVIAFREMAIGLSAGMVLQILFAAAVMAGDRIANTAGLGLAAQVDPTSGSQSPVIGQFFMLFLLAIFVTEDGHLAAIRLILDSYRLIPIGTPIASAVLLDAGLSAAPMMFANAAQLMMPVVSVLLLLNLVIGVITRSAPSLNLFAFGFPLTMTATLLLLFLTVTSLGPALSERVAQALQHLMQMLNGLPNG
ncbi:MAG: flagellar biosynthetic protein FliR [Roseovarius sp.]|uniref:flagellar biosynthetic protein FliR n=1 Tax=Roseovarius sp. TaxID=1486281 RepID=UPI002611FBFA|nr:flagellar biosynthetic protein FliR [Roseovarius sp.]